MYQFFPRQRDYLLEILLKANVSNEEGKDGNKT